MVRRRSSDDARPGAVSRAERRRAVAAIAALGLPDRYTIGDLIEAAGSRAGRPVRVQAWAMPGSAPSGFWAATPNANYVFYDQTLGPEQRDVVLLHELTHILLDHRPDEEIDDAPILAQLAPSVSAANIDRILGRARRHYDSPIEAHTERVARRLALRLSHTEHVTSADDPVAHHIARTLLPKETPP